MNVIVTLVIILTAITISNFISRMISSISSSIITIFIGFLITFIPWINQHVLNPDSQVFMVAILAPLLFFDGQKTPMVNISSNFKNIISNSVFLVMLSALIITILIHTIFGINWALALIMASIATPTDATGFNAVIQNRKVISDVKSQLSQEAMFNDASGMILLQAGILWLSTGKVSFGMNLKNFLIMIIGGVLVGIILGNMVIVFRQILLRSKINVYSAQSLLYFLTPILIYLVAEEFKTSGIIAVVVAGLIHNSESNRSRFIASRQMVFTLQSISFISEVLNSIVFLILGIYLAKMFITPISNPKKVLYHILIGAIVYMLLLIIRFVHHIPNETSIGKVIFSFGGVHGTVTLAMVFSINQTLLGNSLFMGLLITEVTIILLSILIPIIIFPFVLPLNLKTHKNVDKLQSLRLETVRIGISAISREKASPELKEMVLYDLRDQNRENSITNLLRQYRQFGSNSEHLDDLKSRERQDLMIIAFNAELKHLNNLKKKNLNDREYIDEVYSEILYSEVLMLDPERRLV